MKRKFLTLSILLFLALSFVPFYSAKAEVYWGRGLFSEDSSNNNFHVFFNVYTYLDKNDTITYVFKNPDNKAELKTTDFVWDMDDFIKIINFGVIPSVNAGEFETTMNFVKDTGEETATLTLTYKGDIVTSERPFVGVWLTSKELFTGQTADLELDKIIITRAKGGQKIQDPFSPIPIDIQSSITITSAGIPFSAVLKEGGRDVDVMIPFYLAEGIIAQEAGFKYKFEFPQGTSLDTTKSDDLTVLSLFAGVAFEIPKTFANPVITSNEISFNFNETIAIPEKSVVILIIKGEVFVGGLEGIVLNTIKVAGGEYNPNSKISMEGVSMQGAGDACVDGRLKCDAGKGLSCSEGICVAITLKEDGTMGALCQIKGAKRCGAGLVCSSVSLNTPEICRGTDGARGCADTFSAESYVNGSLETLGLNTEHDLCALGLGCDMRDGLPDGRCSNDYGRSNAEQLKLGEESQDIRIQLNRVINIFLSFLAILGVILILYGGILWATSGGNDEQAGKARKVIIAAAIGLIIIGIAWTLTSYILNLGNSLA